MMTRWQNIPFAPARFPVFYGWVIVFTGALGVFMSAPGQTMGISVFTDYLLDALEMTRVQLSTAYMVGTVLSAAALPHAGVVCDKLGSRLMAPAAGFALGLVLLSLSKIDVIAAQVSRITGHKGVVIPFITITLAFFALRFTGQGVLTLASSSMIQQWFERKRGIANSISGTIIAFTFSGTPVILSLLIDRFGWRGAWMVMAAVVGGLFVIIALTFFRDNPECCGLLPDGATSKIIEKSGDAVVRDHTAREATKTFAFWIVALTLSMSALFMTGLTFHLISVFGNAGISEAKAVAIFLPSAVIAVALHLVGGWISDHMDIKYLLILMLIGQLITMGSFMVLSSGIPYWALIVGNGINNGMFGLLSSVTWPKFFGRKHLASITGLSMSLIVFHSALGPFVFSQSLALTGSYKATGVACILISCLLLAGAFRMSNPQFSVAKKYKANGEF